MLKSIVQKAFGKFGYYLRSNHHFGDSMWRDLGDLLERRRISKPLVFDVGAHFGETLESVSRHLPAAEVHCFEPDPNSFEVLKKAAGSGRAVSLWPVALGSEPGEAEFHCNRESMTNSLLKSSVEAHGQFAGLVEHEATIKVPVTTLDLFCSEHGIRRIDLLKTDCQGFDLRVLQGGRGLLESGAVQLVSCEMIFDDEYEGQGSYHEICRLLDECGFRLVGLYNMARNGQHECTFCDGLFKLKGSQG